jgi:dihydroorotase
MNSISGSYFHFPLPKLAFTNGEMFSGDRKALLEITVSRDPKFFFGSDSAPHPVQAKEKKGCPAAGCFTQAYATANVVDALELAVEKGLLKEEQVTQEILENFLSTFGRAFYRVENPGNERIVLEKKGEKIADVFQKEGVELAPFRAGAETWSVRWKS